MAIIQTPSIAAVVEDQSPQLGGDLDCQDYQINDVGLLKWYDDTLPYQASVLFNNTLYFKPSVDTSAKYLFRGAGANKNLQHSILSTEIITYIGSDQSLHTYRGQNASLRYRWRAGDGSNVNAELGTDYLELKDGANPFTQTIFNTYTDASNNEALSIGWGTDIARIGTTAAGTGTVRAVQVGSDLDGSFAGMSANAASDIVYLTTTNQGGKRYYFRNDYMYSDGGADLGTTGFRWANTYTDTITIGDGVDAILTADADNELALRNGTNAQKMSVYNTWTDGANFEALSIAWGSNAAEINTDSAGTGTTRTLRMRQAGGSYWTDWESVGIKFYGAASLNFNVGSASTAFYKNANPDSDGSVSLGTTSTRWLNTYTDSITIGDGVDAVLTADADNELALRNGTNAQKMSVYSTYTDASNYERLAIYYNGTKHAIQSLASGTGVTRDIVIGGAAVNINNVLQPNADSAYNLGQAALRWSTTYTDNLDTKAVINSSINTTSSTGQIAATDTMNLVDASGSVTIRVLPAASSLPVGLQVTFKKIDASANAVVVDAQTGNTIDGQTSVNLTSQYEVLRIINDGSNWHII